MAGWKLRKDKAAAETPGTDPEAAAPPDSEEREPTPEEERPFLPADLPDFDSDADLHFPVSDFGSEDAFAKNGDGPLTLMDYSEPGAEAPPEASHAGAARVYEMPPPFVESDFQQPPFVESDFQQRLKTGRYEASELAPPPDLSSGFGAGIPSVAPFVLDTPPPAAPPPPAPQLVVHVGRLAAAFAVTKEVTTIGRPDSELHYYPDVEIETDDAVSRRHAEVIQRADGYYLADTGSTNGTLLNGEKLPPHQERLLVHGDRIRVGERTEITFE